MTLDDLCDLEKSATLLARQAPWWEPGTALGYHALSIGHLVSESIRRLTGKTLGEFFAEEVGSTALTSGAAPTSSTLRTTPSAYAAKTLEAFSAQKCD